ncbi:MAG: aldo/keto reductase [Cytophagaceae bacterium]
MEDKSIKKFTYGTLSLGKPIGDRNSDIRLIEMALDQEVFLHTSREFQEGRTFDVLSEVLKNYKNNPPGCIVRIRADNPQILANDLHEAIHKLHLNQINIAQLYVQGPDKLSLIRDFEQQGPVWELCQDLLENKLIGELALEVFAYYSEVGVEAVNKDLFKNFVFYYNLIERQANNEFFDLLEEKEDLSILALRPIGDTFADPFITNLRDSNTFTHVVTYDQKYIQEVFEKSQCFSLLELSIRFLLSQKKVKTIIGGTSSINHLDDYISLTDQFYPLEENIINEIKSLHRRWYK